MSTNSVVSANTPNSPMFDGKGQLEFAWLKYFQNIGRIINAAFNQQGQITGQVAPGTTIASTDNITDGTGSPLAGGKKAFLALVSGITGQVLTWNGTAWGPATLPAPPAPPVTKIIAGTNVTISPVTGLGNVTINAAGAAGTILTATAGIVVGSGGGSTTQFVAIAGGVTNNAAFVQQLQAPGIPFTGASTGFVISIASYSMSFVAGGVTLNVTLTPPGGCSFTAGTYQVNIKAIL